MKPADSFDAAPKTHYARAADATHIAYQVVGDGPVDLVYMAPWFSHLEMNWEEDRSAAYFRWLASFTRLILFDRRGNGLSDPVPLDRPPDLETRMDDARAVMEAVGSERAVIYGASESGAMAALFAATYPDRTVALVMQASSAKTAWAPDYPWGITPEEHDMDLDLIERLWGTEEYVRHVWPGVAADDSLVRWCAILARRAMSPAVAAAYERMTWEVDVRDALSAIHVPSLVIHREHDAPEENRYIADHIPGARYVVLPGEEHWEFLGDQDALKEVVEGFIREVIDEEVALDRVLATVLFTDIVGSTELVSRLGDRSWRELLARHHRAVRGIVGRHRGREIDTAGDGFLAAFDGPARAVRCAEQIIGAARGLQLDVRAGLHTGEVEQGGEKIGGLAVHIGARVLGHALGGQVLVSQTVKDLVAGSGLVFEEAGEHELKGVQGKWRLYSLVGS